MMWERRCKAQIEDALAHQPAVAVMGPRHIGKTALARQIGDGRDALYLDLESPSERRRLGDLRQFLKAHEDRLVILDEVRRVPGLFQILRGLINGGLRAGRFLILGGGSANLLGQPGEPLAGHIAHIDLHPLDVLETAPDAVSKLWLRGGYPSSYLADDDQQSLRWRTSFIRAHLLHGLSSYAQRLPAETWKRLWLMLAHRQGSPLNAPHIATSLPANARTTNRCLGVMADLRLIRLLPPCPASASKRPAQPPRVYIRDSGLLHALLGIADRKTLAKSPVAGFSWKGMVIENLLAAAPKGTQASFYRTGGGAEIDLVLELPGQSAPWAIEVKRGPSAKPKRGFHNVREDLKPARCFVVHTGEDRYPAAEGIEGIGLREMAEELAGA